DRAADPALPGYRFAAPVNAPATPPAAAAPVVTTAFKQPTPAAAPTAVKPAAATAPSPTVPYKEPTWTAAPRK
ncbi:MAG: hypothetical protein K2P78_06615, partial [Gemmataceae bacterium]|nr:hypothetical protein [Gemmataceae bacterium]